MCQDFYGDEETVKKLEKLILNSPILRNAPALQIEARYYETPKARQNASITDLTESSEKDNIVKKRWMKK